MVLDRRSPVLRLMQKIRDESPQGLRPPPIIANAARCATATVELLDIPGVGRARGQQLLEHFGSLRGIRRGSARWHSPLGQSSGRRQDPHVLRARRAPARPVDRPAIATANYRRCHFRRVAQLATSSSIQPAPEPHLTLCAAAVSKAVRSHRAALHALQMIVTHRRRRLQACVDIFLVDDVSLLCAVCQSSPSNPPGAPWPPNTVVAQRRDSGPADVAPLLRFRECPAHDVPSS